MQKDTNLVSIWWSYEINICNFFKFSFLTLPRSCFLCKCQPQLLSFSFLLPQWSGTLIYHLLSLIYIIPLRSLRNTHNFCCFMHCIFSFSFYSFIELFLFLFDTNLSTNIYPSTTRWLISAAEYFFWGAVWELCSTFRIFQRWDIKNSWLQEATQVTIGEKYLDSRL